MLVVENLTKSFGRTEAVSGVTLQVPRGQFVGVIGRSGAGKSTLLRMLNRLTDPTKGRIAWDGLDVTSLRGAGLR
ncbi:MAG TPA: ATP-binding cassette domain-containing protein, partial [Acetobacteraceae bacterium]|nr:ATP-binding cassette domain-containing protein [Acetobacteraceae bacterium]